MGDELTRRRFLRDQRLRRPLTPPPMDGTVEQVLEDLTVVTGMVTEILAEIRALPVVPGDLLRAAVLVDDAVTAAYAVAVRHGSAAP